MRKTFLLLLLLIPTVSFAAANYTKWTVPKNVTKIQVTSYKKDGSKIFSYDFDVEAGQVFEITTK
jgi:hypothetical protein